MNRSSNASRAAIRNRSLTAPNAPPSAPVGRTYLANDGCVWRRSHHGWELVDSHVAPRLLAGFLADAENRSDWFHKRAAELATELSDAIGKAGYAKQQELAHEHV